MQVWIQYSSCEVCDYLNVPFMLELLIGFMSFTAEKKSINCTAILMEYKNKVYSVYSVTDESVLE